MTSLASILDALIIQFQAVMNSSHAESTSVVTAADGLSQHRNVTYWVSSYVKRRSRKNPALKSTAGPHRRLTVPDQGLVAKLFGFNRGDLEIATACAQSCAIGTPIVQ